MAKISIAIPVLNEEKRIRNGILELEEFIALQLKERKIKIIVADGNSSDKTLKIIEELQKNFSNLHLKQIGIRGKGFQLKKTFSEEEADFFLQMDVDMATPLKYLKELIFWLEQGYDIVIGSRLKKESKIKRTWHRKIVGESYSFLVRLFFNTSIMDYQCGFKGFCAKSIKPIIPEIKDNEWFFDTELILRALKRGLKIKEIPVEWEEKADSKINILKHSFQMFFSLLFLRLRV